MTPTSIELARLWSQITRQGWDEYRIELVAQLARDYLQLLREKEGNGESTTAVRAPNGGHRV